MRRREHLGRYRAKGEEKVGAVPSWWGGAPRHSPLEPKSSGGEGPGRGAGRGARRGAGERGRTGGFNADSLVVTLTLRGPWSGALRRVELGTGGH